MQSFTDLKVWQKGLILVRDIHVITKQFPRDEQFEMTKQIRNSSKSIIVNVAEGCGRFTYADKAGKYKIARGECTETEAWILIAKSLEYISENDALKLQNQIREIGRMLSGLISACYKQIQ